MSYLRAKPPGDLLLQVQRAEMGVYPFPTMLRDGVVLPAGDPLEQIARGAFNRVPVILGTNRDEVKTMMLRDPNYTDPLLGILPRIGDQALYDRVTGYGSAMWKAVGADEPARAMTASGHEAVYVYQFDWDQMPSNWLLDFKSLMGAGHGLEIPFVFYDIDNEMTYMPIDQIDKDNLAGAEPLARGPCQPTGDVSPTGAHPGRAATKTCPPGSPGRPRRTTWFSIPLPTAVFG
jgi:para-nitrobenzyl esterase